MKMQLLVQLLENTMTSILFFNTQLNDFLDVELSIDDKATSKSS